MGVIEALHVSNRRWDMMPWNKQSNGPWSKLVKVAYATKIQGVNVLNMIRGSVGNGLDIRFWVDTWINDVPLKDLFPNLFVLEKNKWCRVAERIGGDEDRGIFWDWKRYPASNTEIMELIQCHRMVDLVRLNHYSDSWKWNSGSNGMYTVNGTRKWLRSDDVGLEGYRYKWCKWLPNKCNIFMWRASLDRLPTATALARRNVFMGDGLCSFCGEVTENLEHVLTACAVPNGLWMGIAAWLRLPPLIIFSVHDILTMMDHVAIATSRKKVMYGIFIIACWKIWSVRNEIIFRQGTVNVTKMLSEVKAISFLWFNSRSKNARVDWKDWCCFNVT